MKRFWMAWQEKCTPSHSIYRSAFGRHPIGMVRIYKTNCFASDQQITWNCATNSVCHFLRIFRYVNHIWRAYSVIFRALWHINRIIEVTIFYVGFIFSTKIPCITNGAFMFVIIDVLLWCIRVSISENCGHFHGIIVFRSIHIERVCECWFEISRTVCLNQYRINYVKWGKCSSAECRH